MLKFVILLSALACAQAAPEPKGLLPQLDGRIVGGAVATIKSFPWQISLQRSGFHSCGGAIYSTNFIVTAAHCLQNISPSALRVRAGSSFWNSGGVLLKVASFNNHENYNGSSMVNDIAVIKLASSLSFSSTIKPIALATIVPPHDAPAVVTGWGTRLSGAQSLPSQLRYVNMKIVSSEVCGSDIYGYGEDITDTMICTYSVGKDSCQGDSGGPLVSGGVLVGVVSWGDGCAFTNLPGVYSDVVALRPWVENSVNSF